MSKPSSVVLLCEDQMHVRLVYRYLRQCGYNTACVTRKVASEIGKADGGNIGWVLREFPREIQACRARHDTHANTLLIVVADADNFTVAQRRSHLVATPPASDSDPLVALIPRRHVETWIRAALGNSVNETDSYKNPEPKKLEVHAAAKEIFGWARGNPSPGPTCVPSLHAALSEWRKIG